ncbi:MAG: hypothetical protein ABIA02_01485 [Candidatus Falkowbacteria bacterium]
MKFYKLENFIRGWFVGNFEPTIIKNENCEVAIQNYKKGDKEQAHMHKQANEITAIGEGVFKMSGKIIKKGDIVLIEKGEATDFECIEDGHTIVYKDKSVKGDKYLV